MSAEQAFLKIDSVSKYFVEQRGKRPIPVFENFKLEISERQLVVIVGPSGCGKSTLLKLIAGLVQPDTGEIRVMGKPMAPYNPDAITIFQNYSLLPWRTALGNVELPLEGKNWRVEDKKERRKQARMALERVGLMDWLQAYPKELSGGMQQRVALARSVVVEPKILLMDEPFGALDAPTRTEMQGMLVSLWREINNLIIFVTHDIEEALILGERIVVLSNKPAEIIDDFTVDAHLPRKPEFLLREEIKEKRNRILAALYSQKEPSTRGNGTQDAEYEHRRVS